METKKWSDEAWEAALPIYKAITEMPFIKELISGKLPNEKFIFYLKQDELYIRNYSRVLAHIASRLKDVDRTAAFLSFAQDGVAVEEAMHQVYLSGQQAAEMSPSCLMYSSTLTAQGNGPVAVEAAAILPCFWVYWAVGQHIIEEVGDLGSHPYKDWISTYSDPAFTKSNQLAIDICDKLAAESTEAVRRQMTDIFVLCTRLEWRFWHSAYNLEKWEI